MNKIFKIVFNAARGKMMVVNEATSSVQTGKKAAVTVAVIGALASGIATATEFVVDENTFELNSTTAQEWTKDDNVTINVKKGPQGYGVRANTTEVNVGNLTINSDVGGIDTVYNNSHLTINAKNVTIDTGSSAAFYAGNGVDGTIAVNVVDTLKVTGSQLAAVGYPSKSVIINAGKVDAQLDYMPMLSYGNLQISAGSIDIHTAAERLLRNYGHISLDATNGDLSLTGDIRNEASSETYLHGKNITINGDVFSKGNDSTLTINSDVATVLNGKVTARGSKIDFSGDTTINFALNSTDKTDEMVNLSVGVGHAIDVYHSDLTFSGNTSINAITNIEAKNEQFNGLINKGGGKVTFTGDETQIKVTADKQVRSVYGVVASTEDAEISFEGSKVSVDVVAKNTASVYGLWATGPSNLTSSKDTSINILAQGEGEAIGIVAYGNSANIELNGDVTVVAKGGDAYAAYLFNKGCASLGSAGKTVNLTGAVYVEDQSTLTLNGKTIFNGNVNVDGTLDGNAELLLGDTETTVTVDTVADNAQFTIGATGTVNDALGGKVEAVAEKFGNFADGKSVVLEEGAVMGAVTATIENGEVTGETIAVNSKTEALADKVSLAPTMITRIMMNDVRKRMGDLRAAEGTHGVWARYNGGQMSGSGVDSDFSMVQVGIDTVPVVDAPRFGVAFSYAETEAKDNLGTTDMDSLSLAFYGTKMYDNGMFVDVIGRMATMDSDIVNAGAKGKMDNVALSLSGELGWRFDVTDRFFFEPSVEATYTYTNADTFTMTNGGTYELEAVDSLVGRAGFAAGFKCPANKGDVYVRAAVVHEFMGDMTVNSSVNGVAAASLEADGKDTWFEYAIGAQFNVNKNTYVYADIERTEGATMDEDWRANVGVRFAF